MTGEETLIMRDDALNKVVDLFSFSIILYTETKYYALEQKILYTAKKNIIHCKNNISHPKVIFHTEKKYYTPKINIIHCKIPICTEQKY